MIMIHKMICDLYKYLHTTIRLDLLRTERWLEQNLTERIIRIQATDQKRRSNIKSKYSRFSILIVHFDFVLLVVVHCHENVVHVQFEHLRVHVLFDGADGRVRGGRCGRCQIRHRGLNRR